MSEPEGPQCGAAGPAATGSEQPAGEVAGDRPSPESLPYEPTEAEREAPGKSLRRIRLIALAAYAAMAVSMLIYRGFPAVLGLTCSAAVVMINFLWLEEIVDHVLQPTPRLHSWRLTVRALARLALLGVALTVTIFVARFNALSVLLGFSIVVVGIMGEGLYALYRSLAS